MNDNMPSDSAKSRSACKHVVFVVYPDIVLLDLSGPLQVFTHAVDDAGEAIYSTQIVSAMGGPVETNTVLPIPTEPIADALARDVHTVVIVGGDGALIAMHDAAFVSAIAALGKQATRMCSVCSGALVLAATGALDGRRAVTHWEDCHILARDFPSVKVEENPLFIKDGPIWTSAGITAGMDMALAVVAEDAGRAAAMRMARSLVTHMVRSGGQSQFSPVLNRQVLDATGRFEALHQWIAQNLRADLRVEALAEQMNMSVRSFARQYAAQMQTTPAKAVEAIRTETARDLLETTELSVKQIADQCGFGDDERLRRAFMRHMKTSPSDYRQRFSAGTGP